MHHPTGIYCAFCYVEGLPQVGVQKVAMSVGWNPTFSDVQAKTIEPWILHDFDKDFYGHYLRLLVVAHIRDEVKFGGIDDLKREIGADGHFCGEVLDRADLAALRNDPFLNPEVSAVAVALPPAGGDLCAALRTLPALSAGSTRLLLVRHGETEANAAGLLCGRGFDSPLTLLGFQQAAALAKALRFTASAGDGSSLSLAEPSLIASSPLCRAQASADAIADVFPVAARASLAELGEMGYGDLEGRRLVDVRAAVVDVSRRWKAGDVGLRAGGSGGESPVELIARVLPAVERLLIDRPGQIVLLVCHSWVNKALIASVLPGIGLARMQEVPQRNCAVNVLDFHPGRGQGPGVIDPDDGVHAARFCILGMDLVASDSSF